MSYINNVSISDNSKSKVSVGLFGALVTTNPTTQISRVFSQPIDSDRGDTVTVTGTGAVSNQFNRSLLLLTTGGIGTASIQTKTVLRYKTAADIETYFTARFVGTQSVNTSQYIGLFDDYDGVYLGYNGTDFVCGYRNVYANGITGVPPVGGQADTQQVVTLPNGIDPIANIYRYRIRFGYLGIGDILYEVKPEGSDDWLLLHRFNTDGSLTNRTHVGSPLLPMRAEVTSTDNEVSIYSGSWNARTYSERQLIEDKPFFSSGVRVVSGSTTPQPITAFRNKTLDLSGNYPNKVISQMLSAQFATGSEGLYVIQVYKFAPGSITTGTFTSINTNSVLEENATFTTAASAGGLMWETPVAVPSSGTGVANISIDFDRLSFFANPGDEFGIYKTEVIGGAGNNETFWSIGYVDLF